MKKERETIEEVAEKVYPINMMYGGDNNAIARSIFIAGAKWQQERSYSEEDMLNFAWFLIKNVGQYSDDRMAHFEGKYLEQFKNK
jgi:hypothetical protein